MENQTITQPCGCDPRYHSCPSCRTDEENEIYWEEKLEDLEADLDRGDESDEQD